MKKTKIYAAYLPQFHETEDNNKFWGQGFTDWVGVKNAKPQFKGHSQPRVPLDNNYYDLSKIECIKHQVDLANRYGVDGFNIYHYWFKDGKKVLQKPAELILEHPEINISFFFSWDNCSWVRSWSNLAGNNWSPEIDKTLKNGKELLLELDYGYEQQWEEHFYYLLPFFKDDRYLKISGCPVFAFMTSFDKTRLIKMGAYWKKLAQLNGFKGLFLLSRKDEFMNKHLFDAQFLYQPAACSWGKRMSFECKLKKWFGINFKKDCEVKYYYDYEIAWRRLLSYAPSQLKKGLILGSMTSYDDTPRRGKEASILHSSSPELFFKYFSKLYELCCKNDSEILLITAWNEWGEGAYLEPDEKYGYAFLEAIKRIKDEMSIKL